jgi:hypothetical protein
MGLWPTDRDESALLRFIDSKQVRRDFRGSVTACLQQSLDRLRKRLEIERLGADPTRKGKSIFLSVNRPTWRVPIRSTLYGCHCT